MNLSEKKKLDVGDEVTWTDLDADIGSGTYKIIEIVTESGRVETENSVVVLSNGGGHCTEAYVCELA